METKKPIVKCLLCSDRFVSLDGVYDHIEEEHSDQIPKNFTTAQFYYMLKTGKSEGKCVVCGKPTGWNSVTNKYHRFCTNPACKKKYKEEFSKRMIGKYGRTHLLNNPEQQKKMLANRSISGKYRWSDGSAEIPYTGTYELDFLRFLDIFMNFDSDDIISPSPHTYYYIYEGSEKFYIPDFFIPSLNLEIEIKDGGDNPNNHHKIQGVDKVKERLKDNVMISQDQFSYIKIPNKNYDNFFKFLGKAKRNYIENGENTKPIFMIEDESKKFNNNGSEVIKEALLNENDLRKITKNHADKFMHPIYVLLTYTNTTMAKVIKYVTGEPFSHASISFDSSMTEIYSFGRKNYGDDMKFIKENINDGILKDKANEGTYSLYVMFVTEDQKKAIKDKLDEFIQAGDNLKYSLRGLLNIALGRETNIDGEYFCSQFIAELIKAANDNFLKKHPSLYTPYGLIKLEPFKFVDKGKLINYNKQKVDNKVYDLYNKFRLSEIIKQQERTLLTESTTHENTWDSNFYPSYTPYEMLELGVFGGLYLNSDVNEFPSEWFNNAKLTNINKPDGSINYYGVLSGMAWDEWKENGWIDKIDPKGWFQWYCRYFMGRRSYDDERQIKRWKSYISRHAKQVQINCNGDDNNCRPVQKQGLLQWAWDWKQDPSSLSIKGKNLKRIVALASKPKEYISE